MQVQFPAQALCRPPLLQARQLGMGVAVASSGSPDKIAHNLGSSGLAHLFPDPHLVSFLDCPLQHNFAACSAVLKRGMSCLAWAAHCRFKRAACIPPCAPLSLPAGCMGSHARCYAKFSPKRVCNRAQPPMHPLACRLCQPSTCSAASQHLMCTWRRCAESAAPTPLRRLLWRMRVSC